MNSGAIIGHLTAWNIHSEFYQSILMILDLKMCTLGSGCSPCTFHRFRRLDIRWQIKISEDETERRFGTYFLRTNVAALDERSTWDYYNLIRVIETSNRQLPD